jgi:CDP-paratose 2-epimerase
MVRKRILVTGSEGFVGKHLMEALRDRGFEAIGVDRKNGFDLSGSWLPLGIWDSEPDVIVHLASSCSTLGSIHDPLSTFRDTVVTAANISHIAIQRKIPLLLTSSVKARDGMTPYGASKQMVETWASEASRTYGFPLVINRPGTIYGPGQEGSVESGWIAWFLRAKSEGTTVRINGDGLQVRDLLHVSDYVDLLLAQIASPASYIGRTWDVGGGSSNVVTVLEMADHLGLDYTFGPDRYGDARSYIGINDAPGWEPKVHWREQEMFRVD